MVPQVDVVIANGTSNGVQMFLEPIRIARPDLADEVKELVDLVCRRPEGQRIPVIELVRILGINIHPEFQDALVDRGDLSFSSNRFENRGPEIDRTARLLGFDVNINISDHLQGRLTRFHDSFQLGFQPDHSVSVTKFLFRIELRHLDLNLERIFIDFAGAKDVFIDLG